MNADTDTKMHIYTEYKLVQRLNHKTHHFHFFRGTLCKNIFENSYSESYKLII